jgi:hypothetical protein
MGYELVPAYIAADPAGQARLAATADTFAAIALVTNAAGNFLGFGVVVPLYAAAILTTRALPRWIGWLGFLVGALAGWLGLLSPASSVIASISNIGFVGFFVFMLSMGIALLSSRYAAPPCLRRRRVMPELRAEVVARYRGSESSQAVAEAEALSSPLRSKSLGLRR